MAVGGWICGTWSETKRVLYNELYSRDTLACAVPAVTYTVQNNLLFIALANLEPPTYQVAYQSKTIFTALFSVLWLGRQLVRSQWLAVCLLTAGTVLVSDMRASFSDLFRMRSATRVAMEERPKGTTEVGPEPQAPAPT